MGKHWLKVVSLLIIIVSFLIIHGCCWGTKITLILNGATRVSILNTYLNTLIKAMIISLQWFILQVKARQIRFVMLMRFNTTLTAGIYHHVKLVVRFLHFQFMVEIQQLKSYFSFFQVNNQSTSMMMQMFKMWSLNQVLVNRCLLHG